MFFFFNTIYRIAQCEISICLKKGIVSPFLIADAAYVDPKLTWTVPAKVTADTGMDEAMTIGQLNSWKDASLSAYDGWMSAKAKAGSSHTAGVMKWKAKTSGTAYFALKVGTSKSAFTYTFDNFSLTDLTAAQETGIDEMLRSDGPSPRWEGKTYDLSGRMVGSNYNVQHSRFIIKDGHLVLTK